MPKVHIVHVNHSFLHSHCIVEGCERGGVGRGGGSGGSEGAVNEGEERRRGNGVDGDQLSIGDEKAKGGEGHVGNQLHHHSTFLSNVNERLIGTR